MTDQKEIAAEYVEFWERAKKLGEEDKKLYSLSKREKERDRVEKHLIGMIEMYQIRHSSPEERQMTTNFLERQLFRDKPLEGEVCHLTFDMWKDIKQTILKGEYK